MASENTIPSSRPESSSHDEHSAIDSRAHVSLNLFGLPIGGKNPFKARALSLLKSCIGLKYESWDTVEQVKKDDLWDTLMKEFNLSADQKEGSMKAIGIQLKTFRSNLRSTYFKGLDSDGIKALKDQVPEKEHIPVREWNEFVLREASEAKLKQRHQGRVNRAKKTDVHCLGRMSYAEKTEEMVYTLSYFNVYIYYMSCSNS